MNAQNFLPALFIAVMIPSQATAVDRVEWERNWPEWRGPLGSGVAPSATPPLEWSEERNVKWKVEVPGSGNATPIVWDNKVFVLTAIPTGRTSESEAVADSASGSPSRGGPPKEIQQFVVLCLNRDTGEVVWQKTVREEMPHEGHHPDAGFASASPVTDGQHVLAYFGSRGLYCFDMEGNLQWEEDFGDMTVRNAFGEGSSPALQGNTVVVAWDHEGDDDFVVALDKRTGEELWRTERDEGTNWTTPLIVEVDGEYQVVVAGSKAAISYSLATGEEIWRSPELTMNVIPHPVRSDDVVYVTSGFRGAALHAIKLGNTGDLTGTDAVLWSYDRNTPYVPSPVLTDNFLYFASRNSAILTCLNAETGEPYFAAERLEGISDLYASPVAAGRYVYVLGRNGTCLVLERGPELTVVSSNSIDDETDASMAIAGNELFIRGDKALYCIAGE